MSDVDDHGGSTTATTEDPRNGFASMAPVIIGITSAVATVAALFSWDAVERGRFEDECVAQGGVVQQVHNTTRDADNVRGRCLLDGQVVATRK